MSFVHHHTSTVEEVIQQQKKEEEEEMMHTKEKERKRRRRQHSIMLFFSRTLFLSFVYVVELRDAVDVRSMSREFYHTALNVVKIWKCHRQDVVRAKDVRRRDVEETHLG